MPNAKLWYSVWAETDPSDVHTYDNPTDAISELHEWLTFDETPQDTRADFTFNYTLQVHTNGDRYVETGD